jgi:hypothetical protein
MTSYIITPETKAEETMLTEILKRIKLRANIIENIDTEDFAFGQMISSGMKTKSVSKSSVLKALKR